MAASRKDIDPAFQEVGQKAGLEIWRIENFQPVPVPTASYGKFFTGDSYIILKTTALKNGALRHDIHYWLGKDTSQDEAGVAAIKTVELDAALGGRAVQYREVQGHETEKFLSYFKPCIIPQEGGVASGFKHAEAEEHKIRLFVCKGKRVVHVHEVPFARSSLNHDDIFVLDTKSKIFQFNGSSSSIQERAKALEVVQYIKDTYHDGQCDVAAIDDGKMLADADSGEFWGFFGGFAPLPRKLSNNKNVDSLSNKLYCVEKGNPSLMEVDLLKKELLETDKCYLLDCGAELYVWIGRSTSLDNRKNSSRAAEELLQGHDRTTSQIIRVIEGYETVEFRSKFHSWPRTGDGNISEEGRGKVVALLKRQGINIKGLLKSTPAKDEPQPYIDCTGNLQVWRVSGQDKIRLDTSNLSMFYSGDCYIYEYTYPGDEMEEILVGTWFGKQSVEEERSSAISLAGKMVELLKYVPSQARFYEGNEPTQFYAIFQSFTLFKGGLSDGYKRRIAAAGTADVTFKQDSVALFRVQGSGPENMQAIQMEPVASSLNSSYCYILLTGSSVVYTWCGNLAPSIGQELSERQLDLIKPDSQPKIQKEGSELDQFWELLGGKSEYPSQRITRDSESDPHLFSCVLSKGNLKVIEVYNFTQDDLMTEDIYILDCHSEIFVWIGKEVDSKNRVQALNIGEKFLKQDYLLENLSSEAPIYIVSEGNEPPFFTRFFTWDSSKSAVRGNSFQRKLALVKNGNVRKKEKPKRRPPVSHGGRSSVPDNSQRARSMSFSPDRVRVRGRSPAFNALAAKFESPNVRNLSTPPPVVPKLYPKSITPDSGDIPKPKSRAINALAAAFDKPPPARGVLFPRTVKASPVAASKPEPPPVSEKVKEEPEVADEEGLTIYPYERLTTTSLNPVSDIDVVKRESYLSSAEFKEKFAMAKGDFYKLPKWKQNKLKMALQLF
uniref:HP domain-containing protein n=1 Tax=Kalanchoe fedtschenkoi TaxID=63787 RepID=A0A7N0VI90_KALFE